MVHAAPNPDLDTVRHPQRPRSHQDPVDRILLRGKQCHGEQGGRLGPITGIRIDEREVDVAGTRPGEIADLATDPHLVRERPAEDTCDPCAELGNRVGRLVHDATLPGCPARIEGL